MPDRTSRRVRRVIAALIAVAVLVAAAGFWQVRETRVVLREQILVNNRTLAEATASGVDAEMLAHAERIGFFASHPDATAVVRNGDPDSAREAVNFIGLLFPDYVAASLLDVEGTVLGNWPDLDIASATDRAGAAAFADAMSRSGTAVSAPFTHGTGRAVWLAAAIRDGAERIGVIRVAFPLRNLRALDPSLRVPNGGSVLLSDRHGVPLAAPHGALEAGANSSLMPAEGSTAIIPGLPGERLLGHAAIERLGWTVIVEQPASAALRPVTAASNRMGGIVLLVSVAMIVAVGAATRLLKQVWRARTRTAAILTSLADGAVTVDGERRIQNMNPAMERLTGWSTLDARGRRLEEVVHLIHDDGTIVPSEDCALADALRSRRPVARPPGDLSIRARDDHRTPVAVTASPILLGQELIGAVAVFRDVTRDRELDEMKTNLVSTVSHELRTPLTMIKGFSELLLTRGGDDHAVNDALVQIDQAADRLGRLVDDILEVSHLEEREERISPSPVVVREAIQEAIEPFRRRLAGRRFDARVSGHPVGLADPEMLNRILTNLLANAVKYSPESSPIRVTARRRRDHVVVSVTDEGIGMTSEETARIFDRFFRSDRAEVRSNPGTGLGLPITRELVRMQGGHIWVRSTPGRGSAFSFSLPATHTSVKEEPA